jgi:hypothetical protein
VQEGRRCGRRRDQRAEVGHRRGEAQRRLDQQQAAHPLGHSGRQERRHRPAERVPGQDHALDAGQPRLFLVAGLLAASTKEEIGLLVAGLGALALILVLRAMPDTDVFE